MDQILAFIKPLGGIFVHVAYCVLELMIGSPTLVITKWYNNEVTSGSLNLQHTSLNFFFTD